MAAGNIPDDLVGLGAHIVATTLGVLPALGVTVFTHDWDGFYNGPFPVILVRPFDYNTVMLDIGQPGRRGQDAHNPGVYLVTLMDAVDGRGVQVPGGMGLIAQCEINIETLWTAIDNSFDVLANWPGPNNAFKRMGFKTKIRFSKPFAVASDTATRVAAMGMVYCISVPHDGRLT